MQFTPSDTEAILELLRWRRDVRRFRRDPVDSNHIERLQQAMALAPSVGNSRPWRVVNVESPEARQKIIENHASANHNAAQKYTGKQRDEYTALKLAGLREAPVQLAIFTDINPDTGSGLGRQTMPETLTYSTVIAIHQLWLVARTLNLGVGWVSIIETDEINTLLDVDESWKLTAYLCIGFPETDEHTPELHRNGWQENTEIQWLKR